MLSKAYDKGFELAGDTGLKSLATATNSVFETVTLKKGVSYTLKSTFGISNIKGNVALAVQNAAGDTVSSGKSAIGKTTASLSFTPAADGEYTIRLTGQPIAKTKPVITNNLYSGYQIQVQQSLSKLPTKSGNANVDALVLGGTNAWQHALGTTATPSTNVIEGTLRSLTNVVDNNNVISYGFMDATFESHLTGSDAKNASVMDNATQTAVQTAFDYLSSLINVKFVKATNAADATIMFGENDQGTVSAGYANPPNESGSHQQYLFLSNTAATNDATKNNNFAPGTYGWQTLLHEIAHTLGLKHPFNGNAGGGGTPGPYLPTSTNNTRYSIMSYSSAADSKINSVTVNKGLVSLASTTVNPSTFMTYDIAALQYLYGPNTTTNGSSQTLTFTNSYKGMQTLWTPNGDTLDASATTNKNVIDLRGGAYSTINYQGTGIDQFTNQVKAAGITTSTAIASLLKTFKAPIAATYSGNNNVALAYGSKIATAKSGSANDSFFVSNYSSVLYGGLGSDTVYLTGSSNDWVVADNPTLKLNSNGGIFSSSIILTNKTTQAQISLDGIEHYAFYSASSFITKA